MTLDKQSSLTCQSHTAVVLRMVERTEDETPELHLEGGWIQVLLWLSHLHSCDA